MAYVVKAKGKDLYWIQDQGFRRFVDREEAVDKLLTYKSPAEAKKDVIAHMGVMDKQKIFKSVEIVKEAYTSPEAEFRNAVQILMGSPSWQSPEVGGALKRYKVKGVPPKKEIEKLVKHLKKIKNKTAYDERAIDILAGVLRQLNENILRQIIREILREEKMLYKVNYKDGKTDYVLMTHRERTTMPYGNVDSVGGMNAAGKPDLNRIPRGNKIVSYDEMRKKAKKK